VASGVHDVAEGGLGVALAEMAVRSGVGFQAARVADHRELFTEAPSRVVLSVAPDLVTAVEQVCAEAEVGVARIGVASGDRLVVKGLLDVGLAEATQAWRRRLPDALGAGTTQG
jgi:phosphoribosylformylglycinamidine (FGAM) synthase-like enzyme